MTTTFHPSLRAYFKRFGIGRTVLILALLIFLFSRTGIGGLIAALISLGVVLAIVVFAINRRTLEITDTHVNYFGGLFGKKNVPLSEISPVVYLPAYNNFSFGTTPLLIIARNNKPFLVINELFWSENTAPEIIAALEKSGLTVKHDKTPYGDFSMTDAYGSILGFFYKVPRGKSLAYTILATVVGIVLLALIIMALPDIADALDSFWYRVEFTFRSLFRIPS